MFNNTAFMKQAYEPRTCGIKVPELNVFFSADDDEKVWTVRGQTANEIAKGHESSAKNKNIANLLAAVANDKQKIEELKSAVGISDETPNDIVIRLEQLVSCSVSPSIDKPLALKLAETFPIVFYTLTNKIVELSHLGMDVKKPENSGKMAK